MRIKNIVLGFGVLLMSCGAGATKTESETVMEQPAPVESAVESDDATIVMFNGTELTPDARLPKIIDFNADWCGPCRSFKPVFDQVAVQYRGRAIFVSVNVDDNPDVAMQFRVSAIPQITILYPDGTTDRHIGSMDYSEFNALVSTWLNRR